MSHRHRSRSYPSTWTDTEACAHPQPACRLNAPSGIPSKGVPLTESAADGLEVSGASGADAPHRPTAAREELQAARLLLVAPLNGTRGRLLAATASSGTAGLLPPDATDQFGPATLPIEPSPFHSARRWPEQLHVSGPGRTRQPPLFASALGPNRRLLVVLEPCPR